jgi:hypothetical protein
MNEFSVSDETLNEAAQACATRLAKWFGGIDEAIAELEADTVALTQVAIMDFRKAQQHMVLKAHMNPRAVARECLDLIKAGGELPA